MRTEYNLIVENIIWEIEEIKPIGSCWLFARKCGSSGEIARYKARLVAMFFSQTPGTDYNKTYSPTTRLSTIWILLSYALRN